MNFQNILIFFNILKNLSLILFYLGSIIFFPIKYFFYVCYVSLIYNNFVLLLGFLKYLVCTIVSKNN